MAQPELSLILERCLLRLQQGDSVASCLAHYPAEAADLAPLLSLSADLTQLPRLEPDPAAEAAQRKAMFAAFDAQLASSRTEVAWWRRLWAGLPFAGWGSAQRPLANLGRALALVLLVVTLAAGGLVTAAAETLPGDSLYPVKRSVETLRLTYTQDADAAADLLEGFNQERLLEIEQLQAVGRSAEVEFQGVIVAQEQTTWQVADLRFGVPPETRGATDLVVGETAVVGAHLAPDGTLTALYITRPPQTDQRSPAPPPPATASPLASPPSSPTPLATPTPDPSATPPPTRPATPPSTAAPEPLPTVRPPQPISPSATPTAIPPSDRQPTATPERDAPPEPTATSATDRLLSPTVAVTHVATSTPLPTAPPVRDEPPPPTPTPLRDGDGDRRNPP